MSRHDPARRLGPRIAAILRLGTLAAIAAVAGGWVLGLVGGGDGPGARPIDELLAEGGADALAAGGLLLLTLLPFGVLLTAAHTFWADGERRYLVASLITVALLAASLVVAATVVQPS